MKPPESGSSGMERWIIIAGGAATVLGGLITAYPQMIPQWVGFLLMAVGVATMSYGFFVAGRPKAAFWGTPLPDAWIWNWRIDLNTKDLLPLSRLTPLKECARLAYEQTRESNAARMAEREPDGRAAILSWYAHALTGRNGVTLYGKKPPGTKYETVPRENMAQYHFVEGLSALAYHGQTEPQYEDLRIKRSELRRRINEIRSW